MSGKLAVAFLVLFCVGQVCPASLPKSVAVPGNKDPAINGIIHQLNILISRIGQLIGELEYLIGEFERSVAETIDEVNLPQIIINIGNQIEKIIEEAGVTADEAAVCLNEARENVKNLVDIATGSMTECLQPIKPAKEHMQEQISSLSPQGIEVISFISNGITRCFSEHTDNPDELFQCLINLEDQAGPLTNDLTAKIGTAIGENRKMINELLEELTYCVVSVKAVTETQQANIIGNFGHCVSVIGSRANN